MDLPFWIKTHNFTSTQKQAVDFYLKHISYYEVFDGVIFYYIKGAMSLNCGICNEYEQLMILS